jgi:hypothetical protein
LSKVGSLPTRVDPKNWIKTFGGLRFCFQFRALMDVMHFGNVKIMYCANKACHQFIFYAYKYGLHYAEFFKMIQDQQHGRGKTYTNQVMWTQGKNARYLFQNEVMLHYNLGGSGTIWRESLKEILLGLWKANAVVLNITRKIESRKNKYNVNMVTIGWTYPYLWAMVSPCTDEGQLNMMGSIIANDTGSAVNKMQDQGLSHTEFHKRVKAGSDAKTLIDTFTKMDQNGKKKCEEEGTHRGTVFNLVTAANGRSGKKGVA